MSGFGSSEKFCIICGSTYTNADAVLVYREVTYSYICEYTSVYAGLHIQMQMLYLYIGKLHIIHTFVYYADALYTNATLSLLDLLFTLVLIHMAPHIDGNCVGESFLFTIILLRKLSSIVGTPSFISTASLTSRRVD